MEISALCSIVAALTVLPNRSQFFQRESVSLSCGQPGNSSDWTVRRNTSKSMNEACPSAAYRGQGSRCFLETVYLVDSGVYWCQSAAGKCSDSVNITVTGGPVILESPVHPVVEGDSVTVSCRRSITSSSSNLTADFYKDDVWIGSSSTGNVTIRNVSASDEGPYRCNICGVGGSPAAWLAVRARPADTSGPALMCVLLPVVAACLLLLLLAMLLFIWRRHKGKADVSYTDVTIAQAAQPPRIRDQADAAQMFYSTLQLAST